MKMQGVRHGVEQLRGSLAEGWARLRESAADALTRFRPGAATSTPLAEHGGIDAGARRWAMLGGDVFEDDRRLVVRLEAPGLRKDDFSVEVIGDALVVRGEKRFEQESTEGRWRVMQCAYGSFQRTVPLPAPVNAGKAQARYRDGVLRIELPKAVPGRPKLRVIEVV